MAAEEEAEAPPVRLTSGDSWVCSLCTQRNAFTRSICKTCGRSGTAVRETLDPDSLPLHGESLILPAQLEGLVRLGLDLDATDSANWTALHCNAHTGNLDMLQALVARGCDVNARTFDEWTPLHFAAHQGHRQALRLLIRRGAEREPVTNGDGYTPLHLAAIGGHASVCWDLLQAGAAVDARTAIMRRTALHLAAYHGRAMVAEVLLAHSCDVEAVDAEDWTPIQYAKFRGYEDVANCFKVAGFDEPAGLNSRLWAGVREDINARRYDSADEIIERANYDGYAELWSKTKEDEREREQFLQRFAKRYMKADIDTAGQAVRHARKMGQM